MTSPEKRSSAGGREEVRGKTAGAAAGSSSLGGGEGAMEATSRSHAGGRGLARLSLKCPMALWYSRCISHCLPVMSAASVNNFNVSFW